MPLTFPMSNSLFSLTVDCDVATGLEETSTASTELASTAAVNTVETRTHAMMRVRRSSQGSSSARMASYTAIETMRPPSLTSGRNTISGFSVPIFTSTPEVVDN